MQIHLFLLNSKTEEIIIIYLKKYIIYKYIINIFEEMR